MRAQILDIIASIRSSYWLYPTLMMVAAIALSWLTIYIDERVAFRTLNVPFIYLGQPEGARTFLATIAGSVLSIAGLTFSIVMVVLTMASAQYGPRLLENFMRDRSNQLVLGLFISTFLYCLLILRVVRGNASDVGSIFVPQLSLTMSTLLAVINLAAFVFFIHHTTTSIQASTIIARVSDTLTHKILDMSHERSPPEDSPGQRPAQPVTRAELPATSSDSWDPIPSARGGYVRAIDLDELTQIAAQLDLVLEIHRGPGAYVMRGEPLARAYPRGRLASNGSRIEAQFTLGRGRTQTQDYPFLFDQLLEMALRALSPGINDPVTAMMCIDHIADNLNLLARRELPSPQHFDDRGALRVVVPQPDARELLGYLFGPIRSLGRADFLTLQHLLGVIERLEAYSEDLAFSRALRLEAVRVTSDAEAGLSQQDYRRLIDAHAGKAP